MAAIFSAFRHRNFRLFFFGQFVSLVGTWMQTVAQGWLVLQLTDSPFWVGLVSTMGSLPILLLTLYGGVLADQVRKHRALVVLQSLMLLEALTLAVLVQTGRISIAWVIALAVALGTFSAFEVPIRQSFIIEMVGRGDLMNAIALNSSIFNLTRIVGPSLAGILIATTSLAICFFANAASYLAVLAALLLMRFEAAAPSDRRAVGLRELREGVRYALGTPRPRALLALTATFSVFGFSFLTMLPVYARNVLHTEAAGYGGLMSAVGLGASIGALAMAGIGQRTEPSQLIRVAGLVFGVSLLGLAMAPGYWAAALLMGLAGCAMVLNNVTTNTLLQTESPDPLRGRVMGFYSLMVLGMAPFGSLQAGAVSERFGVPASLAMGGIICAVGTIAALRGILSSRPAVPVEPEPPSGADVLTAPTSER